MTPEPPQTEPRESSAGTADASASSDELRTGTFAALHDVHVMRIALVLIALAATIAVLSFAKTILIPVVLAFFLSYVLAPFVNALMRVRLPGTRLFLPRGAAALIIVVLAVGLTGVVGTFIGDQVRRLALEVPNYQDRLVDNLTELRGNVTELQLRVESALEPLRREDEAISPAAAPAGDEERLDTAERVQVFLDQGSGDFWGTTSSFIAGGITGFLGFLAQALMCIFVLVFVLAQGPGMRQRVLEAAGNGPRSRHAIDVILRNVNEDVQRYLFNRFATNTCVAIITGVSLYIYGLDFAFLLGIFAGLFNFIPYVGPIIGTVFPATVAYMQFGDLTDVFWCVLIYGSITGLEGNLVTPFTIGRHLKLNSLAVLLSAIFWGWIWGAPGLLLAIPIVATLKSVSENIDDLRPLAAFLRG
ncbi:AI-2E family transporter [Lujinxingia vulgaris]|uniref:AI-2E family transporter n=1 Tax=Lujinxingia vulgaris TaxID=2600176 RepID=A0A5C6XGG9_9DELT|nr:AI-2E family transporter [Lujinxingia vulgaris]TXD42772.1 AI-2E family transporter [Lujinxingia vulgaris]